KAKVEALEAAQPKPQKSREEQERETREWMDKMHQMREGRMSLAMPPSAVRYFADGVTAADRADLARIAHAPTGPGMISSSSTPSNVGGSNVAGSGTGWAREIPLGPSMHQRYVDAQLDAQDARDK